MTFFPDFFRARKEVRRFHQLEASYRNIVFYAEDASSTVHFEGIIEELTGPLKQKICYLTSSSDDPILNTKNPNILPFYIGEGMQRTSLFMNLKANVFVMTMPDLETFHIKRSKVFSVHYVYIFHSIVSTHLIYRKAAFDHFDTIFCVGPHHLKEIRETESVYGLKAKNLVEHGYGRLDTLIAELELSSPSPKEGKKHVLIAPSWGKNCLLETLGKEIVEVLLNAGFHVTVRPHPFTIKKWPEAIQGIREKFQSCQDFILETDIRSKDSLQAADLMISDWSGAAFEYTLTFGKPVLFIDVPKKTNNPENDKISCIPIEVSMRKQLGRVVAPDQIEKIPGKIGSLLSGGNDFHQRLQEVREFTVFNLGKSGKVGAEEIVKIAGSQ
jgi:YidC/Oxa1 family membrane protein insertase